MRIFFIVFSLLITPFSVTAEVNQSEKLDISELGMQRFEATLKATATEYAIFVVEERRKGKHIRTYEIVSNDARIGLSESLLVVDHSAFHPSLAGPSVLTSETQAALII